MTDMKPDALVADSKRQAVPTHRGYAYQAWQSVHEWVALPSGEVLILEGAEDIDVLKGGQGEGREAKTIQVKETRGSGSVTLNSRDVLEAIGHFWEHQQNNPSVTIRFHFLTTSGRGREQNDPFGETRGLDYWDACKRSGTDLNPLRAFLRDKEALPRDLRDFITSAHNEELRQRLIRHILWDTGNEPQPYVEALIERRVIDYGLRIHSLPPADSLKVIPHLFKRVWDVVCQDQDRRLDHTDFARLFEEVTTERVGVAELRELRRATMLMAQGSLGAFAGGSTTTLISLPAVELITLPLYERLSKRGALVDDLRASLLLSGVLVLRGSTGMGKSTLAGLVSAYPEGGRWRRLDMRGLEPEQIRERLLFAASSESEHPFTDNYVVDDLNFDRQPELYENALAALIYVVRRRGGQVIITTQGELPTRLRLLFDLPEGCSFNVPLLTEVEVREVALNYNCPAGHTLETWGRTISANTSGHPLLVHARVKSLESEGWPAPTAQDIFTPESVGDVRREVRRRFRELLPSEAARTLAYRLSVFSDYFKRNNALHLGQFQPPIANAGEALDLLIGPWVERVSDDYYRLSPLLSGSAEEMLTPEQRKELHEVAAESYLTDRSWTPRELFGALFHGLLGEAILPLLAAVNTSFRVEDKDWAEVSRQLDVLAYFRLRPGEALFPPDPMISLALRWLQFRIAAEVSPMTRAPRVVERWAEELEVFDESRAYPGSRVLMQFIFSNHTLIRLEVPLPVRTVVRNLVGTLASRREGLAQGENPLLRESFGKHAELWGDTTFFVQTAVLRCKGTEELAAFLTALSAQHDEATQEIWAEFRKNHHLAMLLIDPAWLKESKADSPNWTRCLEVLDVAARLSVEHHADSLVAAAYRAKAIIYREYLEDSAKAHEALNEGQEQLGNQHVLLREYRAKLLSLDKNFGEAIAAWEAATPELESEKTPYRVFAYRDAEIAAAGLKDWGNVAQLALKAEAAARSVPLGDDLAVGFHADYAFALWMAGDRAASLSTFVEVMDMLSHLAPPDEDIKSYSLHRKVSHAIAWLKQNVEGGDRFQQPPGGWFSDPDAEAERKEPVQPAIYFWYYLAKVEYACGTGNIIFNRFEEAGRSHEMPHVRASVAKLRLQHALREPTTVSPLIEEFASFAAQLRNYSDSHGEVPENSTWHVQVLVPFLFAALSVRLASHVYPDSAAINRWREDAERHGVYTEALRAWLDFLEKSTGMEQSEIISVMKDQDQRTEVRLLAALLLSRDESIDPENLFYANVVLITTPNAFGLWGEDVESYVAEMISENWRRVVEHQRFALRSPNLTVPEILRACTEGGGFKKAARILLAARGAVQTPLADSLLQQLSATA
jgi:hypothetical protein